MSKFGKSIIQRSKEQRERKAKREQAHRNKLLPRVFQYRISNDEKKKSTPEAVIVPPTQNVSGFKTNSYSKNEDYLKKYISHQQFNQTIVSINNIIDAAVATHKARQKMDIFIVANRLLKVAIGLAVIGIIIMASIVYFDFWGPLSSEQNIIQYVAAGFLLVASLCAMAGVISIQLKKFVKYNNEAQIYNLLGKQLEKINMNFIKSDRSFLRWEVDEKFFWLTLRIKLEQIPEDFECLSEGN